MEQGQAPRGFIGKGSAVTLSAQAVKIVLQLVSTAVLGRLLAPADFGLMGMVAPLLTFFVIFRDLGLNSVAIQKPTLTHQDVTNLFWINIGAGSLIALIVAATGRPTAVFFRDDRLALVIVLLSSTFVVNGLSAQYMASLQRSFRILHLVSIDVVSTASGIAAGIGAAWNEFGYWSLAIVPIVTQCVSLALVVATSPWRPGLPNFDRQVLAMLRKGAGFAGFNIFNFLSRNLDNILIGRFLGESALGYYSRAYNLMLVPLSQVTNPLSQVMVPALSRLVDNPPAYRAAYLGALEKVMFFCCPIITASIVGADWTVWLLLGPKWGTSVPLYVVLGIAGLVQPVGNSTGWLFISQGRSKDMLVWGMVSSMINVASFVVGLHWGLIGMAYAYAAVTVGVTTPALWYWVARRGPVSIGDLAGTTIPFGLANGLGGLAFLFLRDLWMPSAVVGLIGAVAWLFLAQSAILSASPRGRVVIRDIATAGVRLVTCRPAWSR
jgi:PST family polysaccharide transporter